MLLTYQCKCTWWKIVWICYEMGFLGMRYETMFFLLLFFVFVNVTDLPSHGILAWFNPVFTNLSHWHSDRCLKTKYVPITFMKLKSVVRKLLSAPLVLVCNFSSTMWAPAHIIQYQHTLPPVQQNPDCGMRGRETSDGHASAVGKSAMPQQRKLEHNVIRNHALLTPEPM